VIERSGENQPLNALEIDVMKYGEVEAIGLRGRFVLGTPVNELRQKMENLAAHGAHKFVLNLEGVSWMDSSGIGLLMMMLTSTKEAGGSLKLVNPSKQVTQALRMCSVLPLFEVYPEEKEAIASFVGS
jgi:anti-sigma B factor antagonist